VQVFLVRHAEAVPETLQLRDPHRHLTAHGRAQARALGDRLRWHDCAPTKIWSSPLVRAVQTAELVAIGLGIEAAVEVVPDLALIEGVRTQRAHRVPHRVVTAAVAALATQLLEQNLRRIGDLRRTSPLPG
jgi:phosphohistidine phosphatase SixA